MQVSDLVAETAAVHPERPAVIEASTGSSVTWAELEDRVAGTAAALLGEGIAPGDRLAVVLPNGAAFAVAYWAALRAGLTVVPVNPLYTPREVEHLLRDADVRAVLADSAVTENVERACAAVADPPRRFELPAAGLAATERVRSSPADAAHVAVICYTSGTTGAPKGACLTHENLLSNLTAFSDLPRLTVTADDVLLGVLPFFHVFGMNVILNAAARAGAGVLAVERFTPRGTARATADHGVTVAYGAPPVYAAWSTLSDVSVPTLRAAVSGADSLPVATFERFHERFGLEILEGYGLTETAPVLASSAAAPEVRPGTVGHPLPNVGVRLVGPTGEDVATGNVGEIVAAGPNVFAGYHGQPEATAEVCPDGWLRTGDLGAFDEDGYLTIRGRLKHMLIVNGFNVYPREVEDVIRAHPGVGDVAVVGLPDERTGQRVRAVVVPRAGAEVDRNALLEFCRGRLARYKVPREVHVVEALPRLPTGKLARSRLTE